MSDVGPPKSAPGGRRIVRSHEVSLFSDHFGVLRGPLRPKGELGRSIHIWRLMMGPAPSIMRRLRGGYHELSQFPLRRTRALVSSRRDFAQ